MRTKFAILLAIAAVCVTTVWAGWAKEQQITSNKYCNDLHYPTGHRVAIAANGVRHLVWEANGFVYYKRYYPTSGWTADLKLSGSTGSITGPASIALDPDGSTVHVVWHEQLAHGNIRYHIFYWKCVPGSSGNGGWVGTPTDLTPSLQRVFMRPVVACYRGHVVVAWCEEYSDVLWFCECIDGTWQTPRSWVFPSAPVGVQSTSIAVDSLNRHGDVYISYIVVPPGGVSYNYVIRRQGGVWQDPEYVTSAGSYPCIEVDPTTGYPHIVLGTLSIYHTYWDEAGWKLPEIIESVGGVPNMFFNGGSAFVVWSLSSSAGSGIRYTIGNYGSWTPPDWVTTNGGRDPNITASTTGNVFVVWRDGSGAKYPQVWGRLYSPGSGGGMAAPIAISLPGVELFPNPAKAGRVMVQYTLPLAGPMTVTLLDVSGRAVKTQEIPASDRSGSFSINVSGLRAGVYILRLETGTSNLIRKLVIE